MLINKHDKKTIDKNKKITKIATNKNKQKRYKKQQQTY